MTDWEEVFPPLDISVVARAIAEKCRQSWEEANSAVSPYWHGRPPVYPYGTFEKLYEAVVEYLKTYDTGRTAALKFYKDELIRLRQVIVEPMVIVKGKPE